MSYRVAMLRHYLKLLKDCSTVDNRTAQDWDKGIRQFSGGRVHADGTVVRYNSRVKRSLVRNPRHSYAREVPLDPGALERVVDPWFLSLQEREFIHDLYSRGTSMRSIAVTLARSPSTISRELRRNQQDTVGYLPLCRAPRHGVAPHASQAPKAAADQRVTSLRVRKAGAEMATRANQQQTGQGLSYGSGDACVSRNDLPGALYPGPRRPQTRSSRRPPPRPHPPQATAQHRTPLEQIHHPHDQHLRATSRG